MTTYPPILCAHLPPTMRSNAFLWITAICVLVFDTTVAVLFLFILSAISPKLSPVPSFLMIALFGYLLSTLPAVPVVVGIKLFYALFLGDTAEWFSIEAAREKFPTILVEFGVASLLGLITWFALNIAYFSRLLLGLLEWSY